MGGNDLVCAVQPELAIPARQFNCPFVSLSAAVTEENPVQTAMIDQKLG
jgi:hypothetical protein